MFQNADVNLKVAEVIEADPLVAPLVRLVNRNGEREPAICCSADCPRGDVAGRFCSRVARAF